MRIEMLNQFMINHNQEATIVMLCENIYSCALTLNISSNPYVNFN